METPRTPQRRLILLAALVLAAGAGLAEDEPTPLPLSGRTVALDAGHEPPFASTDCGRCRWMGSGRSSHFFDVRWSYPDHPLSLTGGPYKGALAEYELNQDLVRRVALLLLEAGSRVVLTRIGPPVDSVSAATTDTLVGRDIRHRPITQATLAELVAAATSRNHLNLQPIDAVYREPGRLKSTIRGLENVLARGERANRSGADLALVFHADTVTDPAVRGRLLFVYNPGNPHVHDKAYLPPPEGRSLQLANAIETGLMGEDGIPLSGLFGRDLWYLSTARMPAVLIEVGRLTNREDADWLAVTANRQTCAAAIAAGIESFLSVAP